MASAEAPPRRTADTGIQRRTVLFFADAVTLAHLARPSALARGLNGHYRAVLAYDHRYANFLRGLNIETVPLETMPSAQFLRSVDRGQPLYDASTLRRYVLDDLDLIRKVQPDAVVGDHRLSLSVSARVAGVPYLNIINAYWSPHAALRSLPVPDMPMTRLLGVPLAQALFRMAWPLASAWHCAPLNIVRREHGLPSLGHDWFRVYSDGDHTLFADAPELVPARTTVGVHTFLGPVPWVPDVPLPPWWDTLPTTRPVVYVTMGSSGNPAVAGLVMDALADLPVTVITTTAGHTGLKTPPNAYQVDFAPGDMLAARASLMINNGGSLTVYQALAVGKPIIGIASHMDQLLSMAQVEKAGVGLLLRSDQLDAGQVRTAVTRVLADRDLQARAMALGHQLRKHDPAKALLAVLDALLPSEQA